MSNNEHAALIDKTILTLRIIVATLVLGVLTMTAISAALGPTTPKPPAEAPKIPADAKLPVITVAALLMAATLVPLSVAFSGITTDSLRKKLAAGVSPTGAEPGDVPGLLAIFQTKTIIAAAMTEGPGFFAAIAYMIEGNPIALVLALLLAAFVAMRFPMRDRVDHWLEGQMERLRLERQGIVIS